MISCLYMICVNLGSHLPDANTLCIFYNLYVLHMFACTWLGWLCRSETTTTMAQRGPLVSQLALSTYVDSRRRWNKASYVRISAGCTSTFVVCWRRNRPVDWTHGHATISSSACSHNQRHYGLVFDVAIWDPRTLSGKTPIDLSGALQRQYGPVHLFTSPPEIVWCLMAIQHALFLPDTCDPITNENSVPPPRWNSESVTFTHSRTSVRHCLDVRR